MNSIPPEEHSGEESDSGKDLSPLVSQVPPAPRDPDNTRKCCQNKTPWWKKIVDIGTFGAATGAFVAAAFYAGIAHHQHITQIQSMQIDDRPWIAITSWEGHIDPDKPYWIKTSFANVGKTPALNFKVTMNYEIFPKDHILTTQDIQFRKTERSDSKEFNTWYPGTLNTLPGPWTPKFYFDESISRTDWNQLMSKDKMFYFFWKATYKDVFGRSMESHFCVYYPSVELDPPPTACAIYNDVTPEPK